MSKTYQVRIGVLGTEPVTVTEDEIRKAIAETREFTRVLFIETDQAREYYNKYQLSPANGKRVEDKRVRFVGIKGLKLSGWDEYTVWESTLGFGSDSSLASTKKDLVQVVNYIDKFEKALNKGKLSPGDWFPYARNNKYSHYGVPDTAKCDRCGHELKSASITKHQLTESCRFGAQVKKAKSLEYKPAHSATKAVETAVLRGDVEGMAIPMKYMLWLPKWALDAIKTYEDNKGFSGLTLVQYLEKMSPDKSNSPPQQTSL